MTVKEFARLAEAWGADIARWPEAVRAQASAIAGSPEAEAILAAQRRLDALLAAAAPDVTPARIDRAIHAVVMQLAQEKPRARLADLLTRWLVPAAGLAFAAALGALIAYTGPLADTGPDDSPGVLTSIFDSNAFGQEWIVL